MPQEIPKELKSFLENLEKEESPGHWGFTVYSTYPASLSTEETFDKRVCDRFQTYIEAYLCFNIEEPYGVKVPLDIEYIRLPSASIAEARRHFRAKYGWPEKHETSILRSHLHWGMRYNVFIVIDEETMKTFLDAPEAISEMPAGTIYEEATKREDEFVIKIVDVGYDETCQGTMFFTRSRSVSKNSPYSVTFHGYSKTTPRWLYEAWYELMKDIETSGCGVQVCLVASITTASMKFLNLPEEAERPEFRTLFQSKWNYQKPNSEINQVILPYNAFHPSPSPDPSPTSPTLSSSAPTHQQ